MELVARVFEESSAAFVRDVAREQPALVLDLGCGPGASTRLLADLTRARTVVGLDNSDSFLRAARDLRSPNTWFVRHDVTTGFPTRPPDLVYARLLLAHLRDPAAVAAGWARQLAPGGLLLLDEVEYIHTQHPVFAFYEEVVVGLVAARGAPMYAGPLITELSGPGVAKVADAVGRHDVTTGDAARMYAMNLASWRDDPYVVENYDRTAIDELAAGLQHVARSPATGEIEWGLRQVAYRRDP